MESQRLSLLERNGEKSYFKFIKKSCVLCLGVKHCIELLPLQKPAGVTQALSSTSATLSKYHPEFFWELCLKKPSGSFIL